MPWRRRSVNLNATVHTVKLALARHRPQRRPRMLTSSMW
jgi:hypothetical protein